MRCYLKAGIFKTGGWLFSLKFSILKLMDRGVDESPIVL